jgi:hypothetical protein
VGEDINTVDQLMDLDPLSLTAENIDSIIQYHRKARANATGGKARKDTGPKIDISEVMKNLGGAPTPTAGIVRRR